MTSTRLPKTAEQTETIAASPGRKIPHCRTCGRPMKGHPKVRICSSSRGPACDIASVDAAKQATLVQKFENLEMHSVPITRNLEDGAEPFSLSFDARNIEKGHVKMPGMFRTDSTGTESSIQKSDISDEESNDDNDDIASITSTARPLGRMDSIEERDNFLKVLEGKAKNAVTKVFTISMSEVRGIEENAKQLKLHARIIAPRFVNGSTGDGWLVIGQDKAHVEDLFSRICEEVKQPSSLGASVKGGAVGAVAAWLCLGYS